MFISSKIKLIYKFENFQCTLAVKIRAQFRSKIYNFRKSGFSTFGLEVLERGPGNSNWEKCIPAIKVEMLMDSET